MNENDTLRGGALLSYGIGLADLFVPVAPTHDGTFRLFRSGWGTNQYGEQVRISEVLSEHRSIRDAVLAMVIEMQPTQGHGVLKKLLLEEEPHE